MRLASGVANSGGEEEGFTSRLSKKNAAKRRSSGASRNSDYQKQVKRQKLHRYVVGHVEREDLDRIRQAK